MEAVAAALREVNGSLTLTGHYTYQSTGPSGSFSQGWLPCQSDEVNLRDQVPGPDERAALNAAHRATGAETGFWNDDGQPAAWPDDIDEWRPCTPEPATADPGEQPF